ncbi:hypothetical protein BKA70DRAFT_340507 [Coprinopsis sp. MPI-PUGE-AT-0042]|nr:hypothetical protein BKA70DRAFT_340507 [Coprinopsis sp. MPI-PUGE-AT-0042]
MPRGRQEKRRLENPARAKVSTTEGSDDEPVEVQVAASREAERVSYKKQVASSEAELANFISGGSLISNNTRSYARKHQSFCPGLATVSRLLLLQVFILKNYLTQCHFHTLTERGPNGKNDFNREPGSKHEVSGVPYPTSKAALAKPEVQERLGHRQPRTVGVIAKDATAPPLKHVNKAGGLTLEELYSFYRFEDGRYILHCGCDLEEVLLDFFLWKTSPLLTSHSKGHREEYGSPLSPRQRLYQFVNLQTLHFRLDDHLLYDTRGHIRTIVNRRRSLHAAIQQEVDAENLAAEKAEGSKASEKKEKRVWKYDDVPDSSKSIAGSREGTPEA